MGFFDRFRSKKESTPEEVSEPGGGLSECDAKPHHVFLAYIRRLREGGPADPAFEQKTCGRDLNFNMLNLAEVMFAISKESDIPIDKISDFLRCGSSPDFAILLERIAVLAEEFSEAERDALLASGAFGDESLEIDPEFDNVGLIVKYCRAVELLKDDQHFGERRVAMAREKARAEMEQLHQEVSGAIERCLLMCEDELPDGVAEEIRQYLWHNELGLATELLAYMAGEHGASINREVKDAIMRIFDKMGYEEDDPEQYLFFKEWLGEL
jgi:hypothetical protein